MTDVLSLAAELAEPSGWRTYAACAGMDTEVFFPIKGGDPSHALAVCRQCSVAQECLDERMGSKTACTFDDGIFGGSTQRQRAAMRAGELAQVANPAQGDATEHRIRLRTNPEPVEQPGVRHPQSDPGGFREHMRGLRSPRPEWGGLDSCGTERGYQRHRTLRETPCGSCTDAHRDAYQRKRSA